MSHLLTVATKGAPLTPTEADENLNLLETRTGDGWADIVAELYTRTSPQAAGVNLFRNGIYLYEFDAAELREAFSNFHMPHAWRPGTMIYPHVHYSITSNNSGVVRWGFEYTLARRNDSTGVTAFAATQTLYVEQSISANSAYTHFVAEAAQDAGIPGTDLEVDAMILVRVFRDAEHVNDTFPDSAFGITVDLHIEVDRHATPNRAPNFYT